MDLEEAVKFLKKYVKESAVAGQMHISPDLVNVEDLPKFNQAFKCAQDAVFLGEISQAQLMEKLGLS